MVKYLITTAIAVAALGVSFFTFYFARLSKGRIIMTRPLFIALEPGDGRGRASAIVFAALIHATADRGKYIERLYVCLEREDGVQYFSECRYEDRGIFRPGTFFVDKQGLSTSFHCWSPGHGGSYLFGPGEYTMRVFVVPQGEGVREVGEARFSLTAELCREMRRHDKGVLFSWSPGSRRYIAQMHEPDRPARAW